MSKAMHALKVHEFAHNLFNQLQNIVNTWGSPVVESKVVSKSKPSGNFHPCMVLNTSRVLATLKKPSLTQFDQTF